MPLQSRTLDLVLRLGSLHAGKVQRDAAGRPGVPRVAHLLWIEQPVRITPCGAPPHRRPSHWRAVTVAHGGSIWRAHLNHHRLETLREAPRQFTRAATQDPPHHTAPHRKARQPWRRGVLAKLTRSTSLIRLPSDTTALPVRLTAPSPFAPLLRTPRRSLSLAHAVSLLSSL